MFVDFVPQLPQRPGPSGSDPAEWNPGDMCNLGVGPMIVGEQHPYQVSSERRQLVDEITQYPCDVGIDGALLGTCGRIGDGL